MPDSAAAFIDAIKAGEFERVKQMASADPALIDARSRTGESAILTAVYHRQKEIVNLLVARGAAMSIFEACAAGEVERAERLVDAAAVNDHSPHGRTPPPPAPFLRPLENPGLLPAHPARLAPPPPNPERDPPPPP